MYYNSIKKEVCKILLYDRHIITRIDYSIVIVLVMMCVKMYEIEQRFSGILLLIADVIYFFFHVI